MFTHLLMLAVLFKFCKAILPGTGMSAQLSDCDNHNIYGYAASMARLMLAEDIGGGDLNDTLNNRYPELEAFYNEVASTMVLVENGAQAISDSSRQVERLRTFSTYLQVALVDNFFTAWLNHCYSVVQYKYNPQTGSISLHENMRLPEATCLCGNYQERATLNQPLLILDSSLFGVTHQIHINNNQEATIEVAQYHIIPLPLISRFLRRWLQDDLTSGTVNGSINNCLKTLYGRLRRSLQKILLVLMSHSRGSNRESYNVLFNDSLSLSGVFAANLIGRDRNWLSGNIFLGPRNRGPFNPAFGRNEQEMLHTFETDVEPIIGHNRYTQLHDVFLVLNEYLRLVNRLNVWERLTNGLGVFLLMMHSISRYDVTPLNYTQWQEYFTFDKEGESVPCWAIKQVMPGRFSRATDELDDEDIEKIPTQDLFKGQWSNFVTNLLHISMGDQNESLPWMSDLTCLYNAYLNCKLDSGNISCSNCSSFDTFLLSKISSDWNELVCDKYQSYSNELCQTWKRILVVLEIKTQFVNVAESEENFFSERKAKSHLQDVEMIMSWLSRKLKSRKESGNCEMKKLVQPAKNDQLLDILLRQVVRSTRMLLVY